MSRPSPTLEHSASVHPADAIAARFRQRFGGEPRLFQAPGRISIIGEHTDYNGGLVMPAAIDRRTVVAARANGSRRLTAVAGLYDAEAAADLDRLESGQGWLDYVAGVASVLAAAGVDVPGADLWIESDVPVGAGLSSSAALEVAVAHALLALAGLTEKPLQIARWAQAAENGFVGMPCGIMDQFAAAAGVAGTALMLDCATLIATPVPLPERASFLVVDSGVRHAHVDDGYVRVREYCEAAARALGVAMLSEVADADLAQALSRLPADLAPSCRHVVSENARVRAAAAALGRGDLAALGKLMDASHASLRDDLRVSTPEVDRLVGIAQTTPSVLGARMMGGGFGGCIIALVPADEADHAAEAIARGYGGAPGAFVCRAVDGAGEIRE